MADGALLEDGVVRAGAVATALVAVGVVVRWLAHRALKWLGVDRVSALERKVDDVRHDLHELRHHSDERLARIEGQVAAILALVSGGNATGHRESE